MTINREPLPFWQNTEIATPIEGPYSDLIGKRVTESFSEFQRQLSHDLYGDTIPFVPPTHWQRFRNWIGDNRITNAWLVLIGREDIDRGYD